MRHAAAFVLTAGLAFILHAGGCATQGPCDINSDCGPGQYCAAGRCRRDCIDTAKDCDPGTVCDPVTGRCQPPGDGGGSVDASSDATSPSDAGSDGAGADATSSSDAEGGAGTKRELDRCAGDGECISGLLCRPLYKGGPARCTRPCSTTANCFGGTRCLTIGTEKYCAAVDVGRACSVQSPGACNYGCVSPGYCTLECQTGLDCPNGYGCATVSNVKVCVRAEEYCGGGGATCTSSLCDTGMLVSSCTLSCGAASDCPQRALPLAPWTCTGGVCKRPADVHGPLAQGAPAEYACLGQTKVVLCNDALHIDFDQFAIPPEPAFSCPVQSSVAGVAGDRCVDSCRYAGACAHGFACTGVGNVGGQRVGLCLPALGAGEVGASCAKDADCAFGYCAQGKCSRDCTVDGLCPTGSTCTAAGGPNVENLPFRRCQ
jgi:hypothetical protein